MCLLLIYSPLWGSNANVNTNMIINTNTNTNTETVLEHDPTKSLYLLQKLSERDTNVHLNVEAQMFFRNK